MLDMFYRTCFLLANKLSYQCLIFTIYEFFGFLFLWVHFYISTHNHIYYYCFDRFYLSLFFKLQFLEDIPNIVKLIPEHQVIKTVGKLHRFFYRFNEGIESGLSWCCWWIILCPIFGEYIIISKIVLIIFCLHCFNRIDLSFFSYKLFKVIIYTVETNFKHQGKHKW